VNTREQGAIGVGKAIAYYAAKGYAVFIPVSDVSRYDLIVDTGERLLRVEVKTTTQVNGHVRLTTQGGNQSWNRVIKKISSDECDLVFLVNLNTGSEQEYEASFLTGRSSIKVA
jgi:PD-(D/E)XK endonuclease